MKKALVMGLALAMLLGMTACGRRGEPTAFVGSSESPPELAAPQSSGSSHALRLEPQEVEEFSNIEVDVLAADIRLCPGEGWSVAYQVSDKEPIERLEVAGGTLYVETAFDPDGYFEHSSDWHVTVTVPKDAPLSKLKLHTLSGTVALSDLSCQSASLHSLSGEVEVQNLTAGELELETASGAIETKGLSAEQLKVETVSGDLCLDGALGALEANTVSGALEVEGSLAKSGDLNGVSGSIKLTLSHDAALEVSTYGKLAYNGSSVRGSLQTEEGVPVTIKSVSGDVTIETGGTQPNQLM